MTKIVMVWTTLPSSLCDNIVTIPVASLGPVIGYLLPSQEPLLTAAILAAFALE